MHKQLSISGHTKDCQKISLITDLVTGEISCSCCGSVISERVEDLGYDSSINPDQYSRNSRTGQKISLKMADMGLSTIIEAKNKDVTGRSLSSENKRVFYRLRLWDRNSRYTNTQKSFQKAFTLLDAIRSKLALPEPVVEQSAYIFRKIVSKKIPGGRSIVVLLCASVYISCRITNTPRTIQDISEAGNVKRKQLQRIYRFLANELDIHPISYTPTEFVTRIANKTNSSEKTQRRALAILGIAQKDGVSTSKNPMSMAAAAIHIASRENLEKISQTEISKISGISTVTIRERSKDIKKILQKRTKKL